MPDAEHYLKDTPYIVMEAGKKSWGAQCVCGWRSPLFADQDELMAAVNEHFANPGKPPKKKRWWNKSEYDYQDRRRG